ncbi:MAG: hypothetical protein WC866_04425 [Patescibacteria group bacterium]|jgi:hypothetical protein
MSDGLSEGHRWAEEREDLQRKRDAFFHMIMRTALENRQVGDLKPDFETFDAIRYTDHIARGRLGKTAHRRWASFRVTLMTAMRKGDERCWAQILTLALQYASPSVTEELRQFSEAFALHQIALYAPNGSGQGGTWYGNVEAVLGAIAAGGKATVVEIEDRERAIVSITLGSEKENVDPGRSTLRFLAAHDKRLKKT